MKSYTDKQLEQLSTMAWRMRREVEHDAADMPALDLCWMRWLFSATTWQQSGSVDMMRCVLGGGSHELRRVHRWQAARDGRSGV